MRLGQQLTLISALVAYLIGSGFATGQETMQFFSGWGSIWECLLVAIVTFCMMFFTYLAYAYAGRTREINDMSGIFQLYAGHWGGKACELLAWSFNLSCYLFMVSGFGHVLHQQWAFPLAIGNALAIIISVGTASAGLGKMISVISKIGPVVVGFTLIVGLISSFSYYPLINHGNAAIISEQVAVTRAGSNALSAGLSFGGCCLLLVSAMVGRIGTELRSYRFRYTISVLGTASFIFVFCSVVIALNHIGNIEQLAPTAIPNLVLANNIFGKIGDLFAIIILIAIFSTLCPIIWTCVSLLVKDETSPRYKLTCLFAGIATYFVTLHLPYQILLNYVMTYFGYLGAIVCAVVVGRFIGLIIEDVQKLPSHN